MRSSERTSLSKAVVRFQAVTRGWLSRRRLPRRPAASPATAPKAALTEPLAAAQIQARWRGVLTRNLLQGPRRIPVQSRIRSLQSAAIGHRERLRIRQRHQETLDHAHRLCASMRLQAAARSMLARHACRRAAVQRTWARGILLVVGRTLICRSAVRSCGAMRVQVAWRRRSSARARRAKGKRYLSVIFAQRFWRGVLARKAFSVRWHAMVYIQCWLFNAATKQHLPFLRVHRAVLCCRSVFLL